jgi:hypothetical protein
MEIIKSRSIEKNAEVKIFGYNHRGTNKFFSKASITISTSKDS